MSTIAAGTTLTTALVQTGDTTGTLVIQTNGTTTAATFDTSQNLTVVNNVTATRVSVGIGSNTAPSITFTGDTNTGIYSPTADTIAFAEGGTEAMRIDSSANVGIGTSSASTFGKFAVQTSTSANTPIVAITNSALSPQLNHYITDSGSTVRNLNQIGFNTGSSSSANYQGFMTFSTMASAGGTISERMRIDSSGNVGIGTSSPTAPLTIVAPSNGLALQINGRSSDNLGGLYFYANNGTTSYCQITASASEYRVASQSTAVQTFYTNGSERMRIDSSGNVGIGTSSPSSFGKLVISGTLATLPDVNGYALFAGRYSSGFDFATFNTHASTTGYDFQVNGTGRMRITSGGDLQFNSGYGSVATAYGCRVWVNFNGTGTPAIRASGNVTSITDNGTGDFTVNFTTAMPDANYNIVSMGQRNDFNNGDMLVSIYGNVYGTAITTSSVRINTAHASSFTLSDALTACISVFR